MAMLNNQMVPGLLFMCDKHNPYLVGTYLLTIHQLKWDGT